MMAFTFLPHLDSAENSSFIFFRQIVCRSPRKTFALSLDPFNPAPPRRAPALSSGLKEPRLPPRVPCAIYSVPETRTARRSISSQAPPLQAVATGRSPSPDSSYSRHRFPVLSAGAPLLIFPSVRETPLSVFSQRCGDPSITIRRSAQHRHPLRLKGAVLLFSQEPLTPPPSPQGPRLPTSLRQSCRGRLNPVAVAKVRFSHLPMNALHRTPPSHPFIGGFG